MTGERSGSIGRDRLVVAVAYAIVWAALLVNRGLYWDDWVLFGETPAGLIRMYNELGLPWGSPLYIAIFATPFPGWVAHILAFVVYLAATLVFHAILIRVPGLTRRDALIAALVFAVMPVNFARIAVIDQMYGVSLLAFLVATWLLLSHVETPSIGRRIAALLLFAFSFYTASLLVLYAVPIALGFVVLRLAGRGELPAVLWRYADFILLPVVYWIAKSVFLTPTGLYAGYNALSTRSLLAVPGSLPGAAREVLAIPFKFAVDVGGVVGLVVGVLVAVWLVRREALRDDGSEPGPRILSAPVLALAGVAVLILGVVPYLAVGRTPSIWDWSSRHQMLVPLGVGLVAAAAARGIGRPGTIGRSAGIAVVGALIGLAAVADVRTLMAYQVDWFKQQAIIGAVRTTPALAEARHIAVVDRATRLNAMHRTIRFYELNALFEQALGGTDRLVEPENRGPGPDALPRFIERPGYHMSDYTPTPVDLVLEIQPGPHIGVRTTARLLLLEALGSPDLAKELGVIVTLHPRSPGEAAP